MAELRVRQQRVKQTAGEDGVTFDLQAALRELRSEAIQSGLSSEEFDSCLSAVARDKGLGVVASSKRPALRHHRGLCGCAVLLLKAAWLCVLLLSAVLLLAVAHKPTGHLLQKTLHTSIYSMSRAVRFAALELRPYLSLVGYDPFERDCLVENPFLNASERCALFHVKYATELTLNATHSTIPASFFYTNPNEHVYVIRNAVQFTQGLTLDDVMSFPSQHEGRLPHLCLEIGTEETHGLLTFPDFFDRDKMEHYLQLEDSWTFSWQECPDALQPERLLPPLSSPPLPRDVEPDASSVYTAASQWSHVPFLQDLVGGAVVGVAVALGEVRVKMDVVSPSCWEVSSGSFRSTPVLQQGDLLIFDSRFWMFHGSVWSPFALTMTTTFHSSG